MGQVFKTVLILIFWLFSVNFVAGQDSDTAAKGRQVFVQKRCYTCHTINAEADAIQKEKEALAKEKGIEMTSKDEEERIGVDLSDIGKKRDKESLSTYLKDPRSYFKDTPECQKNAKKKYRKRFKGTQEEFEVLIVYLTNLKYESHEEADFVSCLKED